MILLASFNCRSVRNALHDVLALCESYDIICLQEHWLLPCDLGFLNNIHQDFSATGYSAVDLSDGILTGRPYGGTAILYRKCYSNCINVINSTNHRVTAVKLLCEAFSILLLSCYMPTEYHNDESLVLFNDTCAYMEGLIAASYANQICIMGDCNCDVGSRFFACLSQFAVDHSLQFIDKYLLTNAVTFFSDCNQSSSWIDHILASDLLAAKVNEVQVRYDMICSDHRPLVVEFATSFSAPVPHTLPAKSSNRVFWDKLSAEVIQLYKCRLDWFFEHHGSVIANGSMADSIIDRSKVDELYGSITNSLNYAIEPLKCRIKSSPDLAIAGWNEYVADKHAVARSAFLEWRSVGSPRVGILYVSMYKSRAEFKYALRSCKRIEEQVKADRCALAITSSSSKKFWALSRAMLGANQASPPSSIGGVSGSTNITEMWRAHFAALYNSHKVDNAKLKFESQLQASFLKVGVICPFFDADDVSRAVMRLKRNKAAGLDGISAEAIIYGSDTLINQLCMLLNLCLLHGYLPEGFMASVIVPLVKNKNGDLSCCDNYRAIALSNVISRVFESLLLNLIQTTNPFDNHQFGFKPGHSTTLCANVLKSVIRYYTNRGSHVFASFIDFSKAFDSVNYWLLFSKLLSDGVNCFVVNILAYWYSSQKVIVRWAGCISPPFIVGNGTRQGSILSPYLFTRYVRDLVCQIASLKVGCYISGVCCNILLYADDIVLLAPTWSAMQQLLDVLYTEAGSIGLRVNIDKCSSMCFNPLVRAKWVTKKFPAFIVATQPLKMVEVFKYLGHVIRSDLDDIADIRREVRNLFFRTNVFLRKFSVCSGEVKNYCSSHIVHVFTALLYGK